MNGLTMKHLRYFDSLARAGHFGRAAQACSITQPALSLQIKELETMLGANLVERAPREIRLTALGTDFAARARDILRAVDELGDLARASRDRLVGRLRIGVIPTIAPYLLPSVIAELSKSHPGLDIQVRETLTTTLIKELAEARIDTAIVAIPVSEPALLEVPLFTEHFLLVRPHKDEAAPVPGVEELRRMRLLLLEEGHCFRDQALAFCHLPSMRRREALDASSLTTLVQMVGAGIGLTLIPEMAEAVETRSAAVSVVRFRDPQPERTIGLVWRKTNPMAEQLMQLAEIMRGAAAVMRRGPFGSTHASSD